MLTNKKIQTGGLIARWLSEGKTPDQVLDQLYIRCFSRLPTAEERAKVNEILKGSKQPEPGLTDLFWALLNSKEFVFNH